jgi:hypothetical protein
MFRMVSLGRQLSALAAFNAASAKAGADRPCGLIEGTVTRDEAPPPGKAW